MGSFLWLQLLGFVHPFHYSWPLTTELYHILMKSFPPAVPTCSNLSEIVNARETWEQNEAFSKMKKKKKILLVNVYNDIWKS